MKQKVAIIGSWFGGLSAACYLAKAGYDVHVFEKNESLGWRASSFSSDGFRWDMGPSRYLMPDLFEQFFADMERQVDDYLDLVHLSPSYQIRFKDHPTHPVIRIYDDLEKNRKLFEELEPWSTDTLQHYIEKSGEQYHIAMNNFVSKNFSTIRDFFDRKVALKGMKMNIYTTIGKYVEKYFHSDEMQKIIQYPMVFLGSPPYRTPAIYNLMTYVDFGMGVWYPQWGFKSLVDAFVRVWEELWVTYHTDSEVMKIITQDQQQSRRQWNKKSSRVTGIKLADGTTIHCDYIVSNADMHRTETKLLGEDEQTYDQSYRDKHTLAPSGFIMYLGLQKPIEWIDHHTLVFAQDREQWNAEIFDNATPPSDPSYYICRPTVSDPDVAPDGKDNLFVLVPFPSRITMSDEELQWYKEKILDDMERYLDQPIREHIISERIFWPDQFSERYHALGGNALAGGAHIFRQTAIFRPQNMSKKVDWLLYAWGYTNPGIGVPICVISGKLASQRIMK